MNQAGGLQKRFSETRAQRVTEVARMALKNVVSKKLLPWPEVYGSEFWNVVRKEGYNDLIRTNNAELNVSQELIEDFLSQTGRILDGVKDTVDDFVTGTRDHVNGISTTLEGMQQELGSGDELRVQIMQLIAHNKALKSHTAQTEERLKEQAKLIRQLQNKLRVDPLTGLYNRRALESDLKREITRARRYQFPLSVVMADLDHFKRINDNYGHQVGDRVLQKLAAILRHTVREVDCLYRYGGEEFVILLPHTPCKNAMVLAERVRTKVARHVFTARRAGAKIKVTVSLGISELHVDDNEESLLLRTDRALYRAKNRGRNRAEAAC